MAAFLEQHCIVPDGWLVGKHIQLAPFQRRFIRDVYDNPQVTRRAILSIARKNAKTALIAGIALGHVVGPEAQLNGEVISGAMSRDQASKVYNYASKMALMSPTLRDLVRCIDGQKKIVGLNRNATYEAISAEATTAHGGSPVVAILDELGQIRGPKNPFVDAIKSSQGAHLNPLLFVISTQAEDDGDLLSLMIDDAKNSPHTICHLYAAAEDCDLLDRKAWKAANPALGLFRDLAELEHAALEASRMPSAENSFRNLYLNARIPRVSPFVSASVWKSCGRRVPRRPNPELPLWAGLDLSKRTDLTALVLVQEWKIKGVGVWFVWPYFWAPERGIADRSRRDKTPYEEWAREGYITLTPGATVDYEYVADAFGTIFEGLEDSCTAIAYDRWRMDVMQKELDRAECDLPLVPFGQGYRDMSPAVETLEQHLLNRRLAHGMHPVLQSNAANTVVSTDPAENRKFERKRSKGRIDGMVALAMALGAVDKKAPEEPSVYEKRGVLSVPQ